MKSNHDSSRWTSLSAFFRLGQTHFTELLFSLALLLFVSPFVGAFGAISGPTVAVVLITVMLAMMLLSAALAVSENVRQRRVTFLLAVTCPTLTLFAQLSDSKFLSILQGVLTIAFLGYVVLLIIRALFQQVRADYNTIAASLCGYLMIGVIFAIVYALLVEFDGKAIRTSVESDRVMEEIHFGDRSTATALYFSFVTLTTLGYGDITPVSSVARMLTTAEALIGQIYLVVLVARLVGLHLATERIAASDSEKSE